jgi:hypothetical protein
MEVGRVTVEVEPANDAPNNDLDAQKALICSNTFGFTFIDSADFCVLRTSVAEVRFIHKLLCFIKIGRAREIDILGPKTTFRTN